MTLGRRHWFAPFVRGPLFISSNDWCFQIMAAFFFFWDRDSYNAGRPQTHYMAKEDFELWISLPISPKCWSYRYAWPHWLLVLGIQMRVLCVLSKHFNNWATSSAQFLLLNVLFLYIDKLMYWMLNPLLSEVGVPCCFLSVWCLPEVIYLVFFWKMLWIRCCWPNKRLQGHVQCPLESSRGSPISC